MTLIGIILIIIFGYQFANMFLRRTDLLEKLALGYLLGLGIFTFLWFLLNWAGIPYNTLSAMSLVLVLNGVLLIINKIVTGKYFERPRFDFDYFKNLNKTEKVAFGLIIFLSLSAIIANIYWPVRYWDSLVMYDFRAKLFAQSGFMHTAIAQGYFFGYPLLTSLAHTFVYVTGFSNPSFLYGLFYSAFIVISLFNFKKFKLSRAVVFLLTLLVAVSPRLFAHTQWAYTNLPYTIYLVLGSIYLYIGISKKEIGSYILSALLIGLSIWTRNAEPFWLTYIGLAVIAAILMKKWLWPFLYVGIFAIFMMPWRLFQSAAENITRTTVVGEIAAVSSGIIRNIQLTVIRQAFSFMMANVVKMYGIYFVMFAVIILTKFFMKSKKWLIIAIILLNLALTYAGIMSFVIYKPYWQDIPDSLSRMAMFFPPMIVFLFAESLFELASSVKKVRGYHNVNDSKSLWQWFMQIRSGDLKS